MLATLAQLLAPVTVPAFFEAVRRRTRFHVKAADEGRARSLLPWAEIERLTATPALLAEAHLMKDGMPVPAELYAGAAGAGLDVRALHDILGQGASIVINDIARWVPGIERLAVAIERELGVHTVVNGYLSFSSGGAFRPHWDRHDVLILQIHGRKLWRLWEAPLVDPVQRSRESRYAPSGPPLAEAELSPGDVHFIPRGQPHAASVSGDSSVHLTIGLNTLNGVDVLQQLRSAAESDPFLRADLPLGARTAADLRAHEDQLKSRLHQLVDGLSLADFLRQDDLGRSPAARPWLASTPPRPDDLLRLTLRRRVPLAPAVVIGGKQVPLEAVAVAAIDWLFDHDGSSRAALTRALDPPHQPAQIEAALLQLMHFGLVTAERVV